MTKSRGIRDDFLKLVFKPPQWEGGSARWAKEGGRDVTQVIIKVVINYGNAFAF
jgi:hypothetical protein